jgi:hypothetical protein
MPFTLRLFGKAIDSQCSRTKPDMQIQKPFLT